jgi:hypothetical protein
LSSGQSTNGRISLTAADLAAHQQLPDLMSRLEQMMDLLGRYASMFAGLAAEVGEIELDLARRRESKRLRDARYRQRRRNRRKTEVKT